MKPVRDLRRAGTLLGLAAAALMLPAGPAFAQTSPPPTPSPDVVAETVEPEPGATYPVEDIGFVIEELRFPTSSVDGAVTDNGDRSFRLASDVLFEFDRSDLTPRAREELANIARKLTDDPAVGVVTGVEVVGHTDDVGDTAYNDRLSLARAESVRAELTAALGPGVTVGASGRGESEPIAENTTDEGRALNRRVEIVAS